MTPASEPATNRSRTLRVSLLVPIRRLIWDGERVKEKHISERSDRWGRGDSWRRRKVHYSHLLVGHEFEGRLGGDLDDVDAVASP